VLITTPDPGRGPQHWRNRECLTTTLAARSSTSLAAPDSRRQPPPGGESSQGRNSAPVESRVLGQDPSRDAAADAMLQTEIAAESGDAAARLELFRLASDDANLLTLVGNAHARQLALTQP
jgi:hypothetical protein